MLNVRGDDVVAVALSLTFVFQNMAQVLQEGATVLAAVPTMLRSLLGMGAPSALVSE